MLPKSNRTSSQGVQATQNPQDPYVESTKSKKSPATVDEQANDRFGGSPKKSVKDLVGTFNALSPPTPPQGPSLGQSKGNTPQQALPLSKGIQPPLFRRPRREELRESSEDILRQVKPVMLRQMDTTSYDRTIYAAEFYEHVKSLERISANISSDEAMRSFSVNGAQLVAQRRSGHCAALAQHLIGEMPLKIRNAGYLVGGRLFGDMRRRMAGAPAYDHGAAIVRFNNPDMNSDNGAIVFDPSFNFMEPVVVKPTEPFALKKDGEIWHFSFSVDQKTINCIRLPSEKDMNRFKACLIDPNYSEKIMIYRTDELVNPDTAITNSILAVDKRPVIVARSEQSPPPCVVTVSYTKKEVTLRADKISRSIPFSEILAETEFSTAWLSGKSTNSDMSMIPSILSIDKGDFVRQIWRAVRAYDTLKSFFKEEG